MSFASDTSSDIVAMIRNKSFTYFWISRVLTSLAYQMLTVAVGWQIYELTDNVLYLGLVGLAQFLPLVALTLLVGNVADRCERRLIIQICQAVEAAGACILAVGSYQGWLTQEIIIGTVFFLGASKAFEGPTTQAFLPALVKGDWLPRALALSSSSFQTASIIGPALGGLLYTFGPTCLYGIISLLFFSGSLLTSIIQVENKRTWVREPMSMQSVFAGIQFIRTKPAILGAISLDLFAVLLGGVTALLPVYAKEILFVGASGLGLLRSAPAIGALSMSLVLTYTPLKNNIGRRMFFAVIVFGMATLVFAVSTSVIVSFAALVVLGAADVVSVVIRQTLVQLRTPDEMRGRVSAVNFMFIGTSNQLGEFESGLTAALLGLVPSAVLGGIGTIIVAMLWMKIFPELKEIDSLE